MELGYGLLFNILTKVKVLAELFILQQLICMTYLVLLQVVANAVAALSEIGDVSPTAAAMMEINSQTINKLLTALNECTE